MSGWKKSPYEAAQMEREVRESNIKGLGDMDNPPLTSQVFESSQIICTTLEKALEKGGVTNSPVNNLRVLTFSLAVMEQYCFEAVLKEGKLGQELIKDISDKCLEASRDFVREESERRK